MVKNIEFTVFTKPWRFDLPKLAHHVKSMGFDGVEIPVRPGFQVEPDRIEKDLPKAAHIFADHGLRIGSIAGPTTPQTVAACAAANVPMIRTIVKVPPNVSYFDQMASAFAILDTLAPMLEEHGVTVGIQNHCYREVSSTMGLRHLVEHYDPKIVAAVMDVGHCGLAGEPPDLAIDILWSHLGMVNFKNAYWQRVSPPEKAARFECYWTPGAEGMADWQAYARELVRRGYQGDICLSAEYNEEAAVDRLTRADLLLARSLFASECVGAASADAGER